VTSSGSSQGSLKVGIMQPYFLPYIGYFQLIAAVDLFIVYDDVKYTKKGWINRNRMLVNGRDAIFSLPLKHASDALDVRDRDLATDFHPEKLLNQFAGSYRRAPYYAEVFPLVEQIIRCPERNLFRFLHNSIATICRHLGITTEIRTSSEIGVARSLTSQDRVLATCEAVGASVYINAIGGMDLYSRDEFARRAILLKFISSRPLAYAQFGGGFVPALSIVDVLMFNSKESVRTTIAQGFDLI